MKERQEEERKEREEFGEKWKCGGGGGKRGQRNSPEQPSPHLTNFLPTFPRQESVIGRLEVLIQEIKVQQLLVGRDHGRKSIDETKRTGAMGR